MIIKITTQDADKVLKVLRQEYQKLLQDKTEHEGVLESFRSRGENSKLSEITKLLGEKMKQATGENIEDVFEPKVLRDIAEIEDKIKKVEYAIMIMTAGSANAE